MRSTITAPALGERSRFATICSTSSERRIPRQAAAPRTSAPQNHLRHPLGNDEPSRGCATLLARAIPLAIFGAKGEVLARARASSPNARMKAPMRTRQPTSASCRFRKMSNLCRCLCRAAHLQFDLIGLIVFFLLPVARWTDGDAAHWSAGHLSSRSIWCWVYIMMARCGLAHTTQCDRQDDGRFLILLVTALGSFCQHCLGNRFSNSRLAPAPLHCRFGQGDYALSLGRGVIPPSH